MKKYNFINFERKFVFLICLLIFTALFSNPILAINLNQIENTDNFSELNEYFIEFYEKPIAAYSSTIKQEIRNNTMISTKQTFKDILSKKIEDFRDKLNNLHNSAKNDILKLLNINDKNILFKYDFKILSNSILTNKITSESAEKIESLSYVKSVTKSTSISTCLDESVPIINADDVWQLKDSTDNSITGKGINVAIMDTGIDYNHPDLIDNYAGGYDYFNNDADPMDDNWHGTFCAGIVAGVAPDVNIYSYKVMDDKGLGTDGLVISAIEKCLDPNLDGDFSDRFIDIISLSFGNSDVNLTPDHRLCLAMDYAVENGIVVVVAAGNEGPGYKSISWPGYSRQAITVGASDKNDNIASFSSRGPVEWDNKTMLKPDVVAPGVSIKSTTLNGQYQIYNGTSFSTPHVAGAAALLIQFNPDWNVYEIKERIKNGAVKLLNSTGIIYDNYTQGSGRIDVFASTGAELPDIIIESPLSILEKNNFNVLLKDKEGKPIDAFVVFFVPYHIPQIRFGNTLNFKSPSIINPFTKSLDGKIIVLKLLDKIKLEKKIIIKNN